MRLEANTIYRYYNGSVLIQQGKKPTFWLVILNWACA